MKTETHSTDDFSLKMYSTAHFTASNGDSRITRRSTPARMKFTQIASIPRDRAWLQFEAVRLTSEQFQVDYEMVLPLPEVDCRGTFDHKAAKKRPVAHYRVWLDSDNCKRIPLGRTQVSSTNPDFPFHNFQGETDIGLPFRDGAHASWDNEKLGLQIYYKYGGAIYHLLPEEKKEKTA